MAAAPVPHQVADLLQCYVDAKKGAAAVHHLYRLRRRGIDDANTGEVRWDARDKANAELSAASERLLALRADVSILQERYAAVKRVVDGMKGLVSNQTCD